MWSMTRTFTLSVLVWVTVALGGCIGDSVGGGTERAAPVVTGPVFQDGAPAPVQDVLSDCYESVGSFAVPADAYWDRVPEGFRLAPYTAMGTVPLEASLAARALTAAEAPVATPPNPTAFTGEVVAVASACHDGSDAAVNRLLVFLMVEPPSGLEDDAATFGHLLLMAYFTDSQAHADVLEAWGFGSVLGVGPLTANVADDAALRSSETEGSVDSVAARLETVVAGQATQMEGSAARFFATDEDGSLVAIADASFGAFDAMAGQATLSGSAEAGVWQAGADQTGLGLQTWGHTNTWEYVAIEDPDDGADAGAIDP